MTKQYVLEWSKKSNSFHIQPIESHLAQNQLRFIENTSHDWLILMIGTHDVITNMADHHRDRIFEREALRPVKEAI